MGDWKEVSNPTKNILRSLHAYDMWQKQSKYGQWNVEDCQGL